MSYHKKSPHTDHKHKGTHYGFTVHGTATLPGAIGQGVDGHHVAHTDGPGCWMRVPDTLQAAKEQLQPTKEHPFRAHHRMAVPYKKH